MSSKLKITRIFLLLILFIKITSYLEEGNEDFFLKDNDIIKINVKVFILQFYLRKLVQKSS